MAMPLYCFNHLFGAILMSFTDPRIYNFIFNKMLSLKWLWFYQTLPFDIFWYVCKHQQISVYIVHICMLFILLPCIYSRTLAHVATVTCWLYPTLNKFHLILSYLNIPPMISQSQISCNTPTFYIAAIFVKYCYTIGMVVITHELIYGVRAAIR